MASSEDAKNNDGPKWTLKFDPFKALGVSSNNPEPDEIRKAYHSQIRVSHPDKAKGRKEASLAKKLTAAYNFLKNKDVKKLKEVAESLRNTNISDGLTDGDLSHVLVDKTKAEHYRRLFNAHVDVAKNTHFKDNFQSFYTQVFDNVSTQPEVDSVNSYHCHLCEEDFIQVEHHVELVYAPYKEYVTTDAEPGFWAYLEHIFDKEAINWTPATNDTKNWSQENFSESLKKTYDNLTKQLVDDHGLLGEITSATLNCLISKRNESVERICASIIPLLPSSSEVANLIYDDLIFPAFLMIEKDFKDWKTFAFEVSKTSPRMAVIFACAGSSLNPQQDDYFYELGLNIIKWQSDFNYAHLCFLLGSCDINYVAKKILTLSSHIECKRLAAYYLIKTNDLSKLETLGKEAVERGEVYAAHIFYLALMKHHYDNYDWDNAIRTLAKILPTNKLWKAVQALVVDIPELNLNCEAVAEFTVNKISKEWENTKQSTLETILNILLGRKSSMSTSVSVLSIHALCGALHILYGDEEQYSKFKDDILQRIKCNLDTKIAEGDAIFLLAVARIPGISALFKDTLEQKQFLQRGLVKVQPGISYHACLLALRGIYKYKTNNYSEMTSDFASAAMNSNKKIASAIATFLSSNPMIHEKILKSATKQFEQLQSYIDNYTGPPMNDSMFPEILQNVFANEEPQLSACYSLISEGGPDLQILEKDILGRDDIDDEERDRNPGIMTDVELAEKAYNYVNLEVICKGKRETLCCLTMAAQYFYASLLATPEENIPVKFGYLGLILECCSKQLRPYANIYISDPSTGLHAVRAMLSFIFRANQHFSETLRKNRKHDGIVNFIDEGCSKQQADDWQLLLNIRTVCPIIVTEIFTIAEGRLALQFLQNLNYSTIKEKIRSEMYSSNTPKFMYHHILFNAVWSEFLSPEDTEYEKPVPDVASIMLQIENIDDKVDSKEEKDRKQKKNDEILKEKEKIEQLQRELAETPLIDRMGFRLSRENSMILLAELYGYGIEEVEMMMNWQRIRRTPEGFIDTINRTLNFDGEQAYTKFLGIQMNHLTSEVNLLLQTAVPTDPQRPALFSSIDLLEIFGSKILGGFVSFDEMIIPPNKVPDYHSLIIPFHPFFKVRFAGITKEGANKENICGTNYVMTLYHLDLLAKIFTTGQEVGANFPFPFLNTENNLLRTLSKELQETLKPIGPRKKARELRRLEYIHRFWFSVEDVEQEVTQPTKTSTIMYQNVSVVLKTMPMFRNENGLLEDVENEFDEDSPEAKFVKGFNENIHLIEKEFPIIQRIKELAKISACISILLNNKDKLEKDFPSVKNLLSLKLPPTRPYSKCGQPGHACTCCDWVPSVFHYMKVTDEQKLEYLFEKRFSRPYDTAITAEKLRRLGFHEQPEHSSQESTGTEQSSSEKSSQSQNGEGTSKPMLDIGKYDRLEEYRCYGGVIIQPQAKNITGIRPSPNTSYFNLRTILDVTAVAAQFISPVRLATRGISTLNSKSSGGGSKSSGGGSKSSGGGSKSSGGGSKSSDGGSKSSGGGSKSSGGGSKSSDGGSKSSDGGSKSSDGSSKSSGGGSKSSGGGSKSSGGRGGGPKIVLPKGDSQLKHILSGKENHLQDTPQNRKLLIEVANKGKILGTDQFGNTWAHKIMKDGKQVWVSFRGNRIQNGGVNDTPRSFDPKTGLSSPIKPSQK